MFTLDGKKCNAYGFVFYFIFDALSYYVVLALLSLRIDILNAEITGVCGHNRSILPTDGKRNEMVRDLRTYYVKNMSFGPSLLKFRPSLDMP